MIKYLLLLTVLLLSACKQDWQGFIYQDKNNLTNDIKLGHFSSIEDCRNSSHKALTKLNALSTGDYECGLNCKLNGGGPLICEETSR
jgi:hypothetical protein